MPAEDAVKWAHGEVAKVYVWAREKQGGGGKVSASPSRPRHLKSPAERATFVLTRLTSRRRTCQKAGPFRMPRRASARSSGGPIRTGPQFVTYRGVERAVMLSAEDYRKLKSEKPSFVDMLLNGPKLDDEDVDVINRRSRDQGRKVKF